ncbi:SapC family protein [Novosphingobium sp. JCM 18896]|uniref:SapC family protein n=1 Tax=Novosphingobium sp. JCM 18896 TaxID=2989731 RepID=UPI002223C5F9|nr:SapC family protein [Novosphingobium sp. JCM 18896]MCW1430059.1 SapC family protein [Novosphingobium sp. JCM 18896]
MASAPQNSTLPLFYNDLAPLNRGDHAGWHSRGTDRAPWLVGQHAIPLTVEEFPMAQRHFPIIFSGGDDPVPLALLGMNEGVNVFVDDEGQMTDPVYLPAYARRYPFMLAKLSPESEELSLCFDPTSGLIGDFEDGAPLFDGEEASETTKGMLQFCEQFEIAGQKTAQFVAELKKHDLLMDGELALQIDGQEQPFTYRGFRMVDENKLREMRGDVLRGWNQSGLLPLVYAHLFSLDLVRDIFGRQVQMGKGPIEAPKVDATPA